MKRIRTVLLVATLAATLLPVVGSARQKKMVDPIGKYTVTTVSDTGTAMAGTLTIATNAAGDYAGQFESPGLQAPVPILTVAVNGNEVLVVLKTGTTMALVYLERAPDDSFKGTWHKLGDGINATMTRAK